MTTNQQWLGDSKRFLIEKKDKKKHIYSQLEAGGFPTLFLLILQLIFIYWGCVFVFDYYHPSDWFPALDPSVDLRLHPMRITIVNHTSCLNTTLSHLGRVSSIYLCYTFYLSSSTMERSNGRYSKEYQAKSTFNGINGLATPNNLLILVAFALLVILIVMVIFINRVSKSQMQKKIHSSYLSFEGLDNE